MTKHAPTVVRPTAITLTAITPTAITPTAITPTAITLTAITPSAITLTAITSTRVTTLVAAATLALTTVCFAEPPTIHELAPEGTIFVAGVRNAERTMTRLKATSLWELWQSPELARLRADARKDFEADVEKMMHDLDLDADALRMPPGAIGVALFTVMDAELGQFEPGLLFAADYGDHAAATAELVETARRQADEDDGIKYEEREVHGRTVYCVEIPEAPVVEEEPVAGGDWGGDGFADMQDFGGGPEDMMSDAFDELFLVQDGTLFLLSNDMATIAHALEVIDGDTQPVLPNRTDFTGVMEQIGEGDATAAILTKDLGKLVSAMDPMGMAGMVGPMIRQMVGDIQGFGMGTRLDGPDAMVEMTHVVHMPNGKVGLTALLDRPDASGVVPAFAGAGAMSFSTFHFDFQGLPDAVRPLVQLMQMMVPPQPGEAPAMDQTIEQVTSCLGRRLHVIQTLDQPVEADSLRQLMAIECRKPQELEHFLSLTAQRMGMEARDFLGHRIYTVDPAMMAMMPLDVPVAPTDPPAIGLGGGYVFSGPAPAVEQALRSIGDAGKATLADEPAFRRALVVLGSEPVVGWGYSNIVDCFDAGMKISRMEIVREVEREDLVMPRDDDRMGFENVLGNGWPEGVDADLLRRFIGPMAWKMVSTDAGFTVRSYVLDAGK